MSRMCTAASISMVFLHLLLPNHPPRYFQSTAGFSRAWEKMGEWTDRVVVFSTLIYFLFSFLSLFRYISSLSLSLSISLSLSVSNYVCLFSLCLPLPLYLSHSFSHSIFSPTSVACCLEMTLVELRQQATCMTASWHFLLFHRFIYWFIWF